MDNAQLGRERLLPPAAVVGLTSLSRMTIWRQTQKGHFPRPIKISAGRTAWLESDISAWLSAKLSAAEETGAAALSARKVRDKVS